MLGPTVPTGRGRRRSIRTIQHWALGPSSTRGSRPVEHRHRAGLGERGSAGVGPARHGGRRGARRRQQLRHPTEPRTASMQAARRRRRQEHHSESVAARPGWPLSLVDWSGGRSRAGGPSSPACPPNWSTLAQALARSDAAAAADVDVVVGRAEEGHVGAMVTRVVLGT